MLEALFAITVAVLLPLRAWRRHLRGAPAAGTARYLLETSLLTAALGVLLWRRGVSLEGIGLGRGPSLRFAADVAICLGVVVGLDVWSVWRVTRRIRREAVAAPAGVFEDTLAGGRALSSFVPVTIAGAIWEELCFRATVFLLLPATVAGRLAAVAAGSLLFGAQHLRNGRAGFSYAALFGVLFAVLYLVTGNLVAVIVAHAAGNILAAVQWAPRIERARQQAAARRRPIFVG